MMYKTFAPEVPWWAYEGACFIPGFVVKLYILDVMAVAFMLYTM